MRKTLPVWLKEYSESHQNRQNQIIHKICVPLIFFSLFGLLWNIYLGPVRVTYVLIILTLPFYFSLGQKALAAIVLQLLISLGLLQFFFYNSPAWPWCLGIFILAWIGQFVGHKIEGQKPSFFKDLQFLLIGPLWVLLSENDQDLN